MPSIDIHRPHQLSIPATRELVDRMAARMQEKFAIQSQWEGDALRFSRPGVSGKITVDAAAVHVSAELGMLLAPLRGMLEQEIRRKLDEHLG